MNDDKLQKRSSSPVKEKGQYFLAFGVVASMLLVAGFPVFVIFFFAIFAFLLFKMFTSGSRSETREIFEFYLSANEILRDDDRRWFGFELREAIERGENAMRRMTPAPPLLYFSLGALYHKAGDHAASVKYLAEVVDGEKGDELSYLHASPELRSYVRVLRKIERDPGDAPLTSAAVRALERARKLRGRTILEESRAKAAAAQKARPEPAERKEPLPIAASATAGLKPSNGHAASTPARPVPAAPQPRARKTEEDFADRKPISEVLHDIYDRNLQ